MDKVPNSKTSEGVPTSSKLRKSQTPEEVEEIVDLNTERRPDGVVDVTFSSHGRKHKLELVESRKRFGDIPVKLVGASGQFEQQVVNKMKVN